MLKQRYSTRSHDGGQVKTPDLFLSRFSTITTDYSRDWGRGIGSGGRDIGSGGHGIGSEGPGMDSERSRLQRLLSTHNCRHS